MVNDNVIRDQYSTGLSRRNIEKALSAAGKDIEHLQSSDLAVLEDFHTMGRMATKELIELVDISSATRVLDAGCGIGGTSRFIADRYGCHVTAVDLTGEYCQTCDWLNRLVGLDDRIVIRQADITALPFVDAGFDVVVSQHVQMNVFDKAAIYGEASRVLVRGGRLVLWDIVIGRGGEPDYPLPWADIPQRSHLVTSEQLRAAVESAGFAIARWEDLTDQAATVMQMLLAQPPAPLGLHNFVSDFAEKAGNLAGALAEGRLRVIRGIARTTGGG